jgi:membrane protein
MPKHRPHPLRPRPEARPIRREPFFFIDLALAAASGFMLAAVAGRRQDKAALAEELGLPLVPEATSGLSATELNRGRDAERPSEISGKGWIDILWRLIGAFFGDRLPTVAGGIAYSILLSIFPAVAAFVSLYGLLADVQTARDQLEAMRGVLPPDVVTILGDQMTRVASADKGGLTLGFLLGLLVALWSVMGGIKAMFQGLNVAYHETERRNLIRVNLLALLFTLGGMLFVSVVLGAVIVTPVAFTILGVSGDSLGLLRWPVLLGLNVFALSILYRFGPSRRHPKWRWVTWGGVFASLLWLVASILYSWYLANLANFQATYGSLGAFMGFLVWIWLSALVVLIGAELNAQMEHQTLKDTTISDDRPMGERGAVVADTMGARRGSKAAQAFTQAGAEELSRKVMLQQAKASRNLD